MEETLTLHCKEYAFRKGKIIEFLFLICLHNTKLKLNDDQLNMRKKEAKVYVFVYISKLYFITFIY